MGGLKSALLCYMKLCAYCGQQNEDSSRSCQSCGLEFTATEPPRLSEPGEVPPLIEPGIEPERKLTAGPAFAVLGTYLGAQVVVGLLLGIGAVVVQSARTGGPPVDLPPELMAPAMLLSVLGGGAAMLVASLRLLRPHLGDRSATGAAWVIGPGTGVWQGLGSGVLVAFGSLAVAAAFGPLPKPDELGPLAKMGTTPGFAQAGWLVIALLLAPPIEELLFRGVVYAGVRNSFGPVRAAVLVTAIFVALHISEIIYFIPSVFGILGMALAALWFRLRWEAIGPAIAVHLGYNGTAALGALLATWEKQ